MYLYGAKGGESYIMVQEQLGDEVQSKLGSAMVHIIWSEEEQQLPEVKLEAPATTQKQIDDETDAEAKKLLKEQREREINANKQVYAQAKAEDRKHNKEQEEKKGKLCGIIKQRLTDMVRSKLMEHPNFKIFQKDDPVTLLQEIKAVCYNYKGENLQMDDSSKKGHK